MKKPKMEVLRIATAGSVDDGKSTLIGRLLYDSKSLLDDQLSAIATSSKNRGHDYLDLSLLTDGLKAEREQGITIDVAHIYFSSPKRKFIIADTPGHIEYTRNMVTGASNAQLAIILIDARNGVVEQTHRHYFIASLLKIAHVAVCVNKMDLVDYSEERFNEIVADFQGIASKLSHKGQTITYLPISALKGDNVVDHSESTGWYEGPTLLDYLEQVEVEKEVNLTDARFPVQWVIRPQSEKYPDYRGYAGKVASGVFSPGDEVVVLPSGRKTRIARIDTLDGELEEAASPRSVTLILEDDLDVSRGDMIVKENNQPTIGQDLEAELCWMNSRPLNPGGRYLLQHQTRRVRCKLKGIPFKYDINSLRQIESDQELKLNEIGKVALKVAQPVFYDDYGINKANGAFILIDENTNETVGAGMLMSS